MRQENVLLWNTEEPTVKDPVEDRNDSVLHRFFSAKPDKDVSNARSRLLS
jgi:hypothetical protein